MTENQNTAEITYTINVENLATFTKKQTFSKSIQGDNGAPGAAGTNARAVSLTTTSYVISYAADESTPNPSGNLTITATSQNFINGYFKFTGDGFTNDTTYTDGSDANLDTLTWTIPSTYFNTPKTIRVGVAEGDETELAFDTITIVAVKPGLTGGTGAAGADAIVGFLTNESHVVAAETDGTGYSLTTAGGTFKVFEGIIDRTGSSVTYSVQGTNPVSGLTMSINSSGVYSLSGASWTSNEATFTLRAVYSGLTIDKVYTISKSLRGTTGATGPSGPGVVYRGEWANGLEYYKTTTRVDVVSYLSTYYLATLTHTSVIGDATTGQPGVGTHWTTFGAQFSSVATDILLAQNATITKGLVIGEASPTNNAFIRSVGKTGLTSGAGFYLRDDGRFNFGSTTSSIDWNGTTLSFSGASGSGSSFTNSSLSIGQTTSGFDNNGIFLGLVSTSPRISLRKDVNTFFRYNPDNVSPNFNLEIGGNAKIGPLIANRVSDSFENIISSEYTTTGSTLSSTSSSPFVLSRVYTFQNGSRNIRSIAFTYNNSYSALFSPVIITVSITYSGNSVRFFGIFASVGSNLTYSLSNINAEATSVTFTVTKLASGAGSFSQVGESAFVKNQDSISIDNFKVYTSGSVFSRVFQTENLYFNNNSISSFSSNILLENAPVLIKKGATDAIEISYNTDTSIENNRKITLTTPIAALTSSKTIRFPDREGTLAQISQELITATLGQNANSSYFTITGFRKIRFRKSQSADALYTATDFWLDLDNSNEIQATPGSGTTTRSRVYVWANTGGTIFANTFTIERQTNGQIRFRSNAGVSGSTYTWTATGYFI
jgi:hypothetical protein